MESQDTTDSEYTVHSRPSPESEPNRANNKTKLRNDILMGLGIIVLYLVLFGSIKGNVVSNIFLMLFILVTITIVLRHLVRREVFNAKNLPKTIGTVALICAIVTVRIVGIEVFLMYAFQLIFATVWLVVIFFFGKKMGMNIKVMLLLLGIVIVFKGFKQNSPAGKCFMTEDGMSVGFCLGSDQKGDSIITYNEIVRDWAGKPIRHIHREGTFKVVKNTIHCKYNDGLPPYKLEYKKVDGEWCVTDESGNVFIWDDPAKRTQ